MPDWHHSPVHRTLECGMYRVTGSTLHKQHLNYRREHLDWFQAKLLDLLHKHQWHPHAWAIFSNHYHFIAHSGEASTPLPKVIQLLHGSGTHYLNQQDNTRGRKAWFEYWDSVVTFRNSYLARMNYVVNNAVHHGLVKEAETYPWCSARWFSETAPEPFVRTCRSFKSDQISVKDGLEPIMPVD